MAKIYYSDIDMEMTRQTDGDVQRDTDIDAIKNSLQNILNTLQGQRRMIPEFATDMHKLLFQPMDEDTAYAIGNRMLDAILFWDDRIRVLGIEIEPRYDQNEYRCRLDFRVKMTNELGDLDFILQQE